MRQVQLPIAALILFLLFSKGSQLPGTPTIKKSEAGSLPLTLSGKPAPESPLPPVWQALCQLNPEYGSAWYLRNRRKLEQYPMDRDPSCLHGKNGHPVKLAIVSVIATIADPVHTHLGLNFDRTIDAIQASAGEASFLPYLNAVPWPPPQESVQPTQPSGGPVGIYMNMASNKGARDRARLTTLTMGADAGDTAHGYEYPGVLLFKKPSKNHPNGFQYVAVFLVPELPTSGIDQTTFLAAIRIAELISGKSNVIHLAGPSFSGSVSQLPVLLNAVDSQFKQDHIIEAVSGTITKAENRFAPRKYQCGLRSIKLETLQTHDSEALNLFISSIHSTSGYGEREIAILSEEGTEYGEQTQYGEQARSVGDREGKHKSTVTQTEIDRQNTKTSTPLFLHFPREISRLRNSSHPADVPAGTVNERNSSTPSMQPEESLDWQDSHPFIRDDVRNYGKQTPISEETVLASVASTLKARDIKALGILATDPLDTVFLLQFFKRTCPNLRLFVRDPDLLYFRTPNVGSLTGVLLINDFPLVPINQFWSTRASSVHPVILSSASEEGQYNAFAILLRTVLGGDRPNLIETGWPGAPEGFPESIRQPLWLTVAGTSGYFPVRLLNDAAANTYVRQRDLASLDVGKPPYATILLWLLIALIGVVHALWILQARMAPFRFRDEFDITNGDSVSASKAFCHVIAILVLALASLIAGSSFIYFHAARYKILHNSLHLYTFLALICSLVVIGLLCVSARVLWIGVLRPLLEHRRKVRNSAHNQQVRVESDYVAIKHLVSRGLPFAALFVAGFPLWMFSTFSAPQYKNAFLHFRDLYLASGVAPVVPIELFLAVIYIGVVVYLRRLSYFEYGSVDMPDLLLDDIFPCTFQKHVATVKRDLLHVPDVHGLLLFGAVLFGSLLAFRPWATMDMVEARSVQWFVIASFSFGLFILLVNWFRFVAVWRTLRKILRNLEAVPLRWAFARLPRESSLPIWRWSIADRSFLPAVQGVNIFRSLTREAPNLLSPQTRDRFIQSVWEMNHPGYPWPHPTPSSEVNTDTETKADVRVAVLAASGQGSQTVVEIVRQLRDMLRPISTRTESDQTKAGPATTNKSVGGETVIPDQNTGSAANRVFEMRSPRIPGTDLPSKEVSIQEKKELLLDARKAMTAVIRELSAKLISEYWTRGAAAAPKDPLDPSVEDRKYILAEDLIALRFYSYIRYVISELRNLLFFVVVAFSLMFLALHVYAFRADQVINWSFIVMFLILGATVGWVLAQMEKNALLSRLEGSKAGELNKNFYIDVVKYGIVPAITILGSQIPFLSNLVLRWVQPTLEAFR